MAKPITMLATIPFEGFYHSLWSSEIDSQEEYHAEYQADYGQAEDGVAEELRLTQSEIAQILFDVTEYSAAYLAVAQDYVDAFDSWAGEQLNMTRKAKRKRYDYETKKFRVEKYEADSLGLQFESMASPREYNFETDRIFCHIPLKTVRALFKASESENHISLRAAIRERFTSRSGFISHYSNDLETWLDKHLQEWDHNEIGTLLVAMTGEPDSLDDIYYRMGDSWGYEAWESAVNWSRYDEKVAELRAEKLAEIQSDNPDFVPPYRCPETADMFARESRV